MNEDQVRFLNHLIRTGALTFTPTLLKSGRESPYYISIRKAMDTGEGLQEVALAYVKKILTNVGNDFDYVHGPAYTGIPLASSIAIELWRQNGLNTRYGYDRKEAKSHGKKTEKVVVGDLRDGDRVIIVDDVITTGETKLLCWKKLVSIGKHLQAKGIIIGVDREEVDEDGKRVQDYLMHNGLPVYSILRITDVFEWLRGKMMYGRILVTDRVHRQFQEYITKYGIPAT